MKKKVLVSLIVIISLIGAYFTGVYANTSTWKNDKNNEAFTRINAAASNRRNELIAEMDTLVKAKADEILDPQIEEAELQAITEVEVYFDAKLNQLEDSPDILEVEDAIVLYTDIVVDNNKTAIDTAFGY